MKIFNRTFQINLYLKVKYLQQFFVLTLIEFKIKSDYYAADNFFTYQFSWFSFFPFAVFCNTYEVLISRNRGRSGLKNVF